MEIKRKIKTTKAAATATATVTSTFHCYCCCRHILITFVGMTVLIVSYSVNTVQMSAESHRNGNSSSISVDSKNDVIRKILWKKNFEYEHIANRSSKSDKNFQSIALPTTFYANKENDSTADKFQSTSNSHHKEFDLIREYLRRARFFGLFGSNVSLSYNLTLTTGTSAADITVVALAPTYYYYAPAPSYPYYDPNSYYNPYPYYTYDPYNPYAGYTYGPNNPYAGYTYYG